MEKSQSSLPITCRNTSFISPIMIFSMRASCWSMITINSTCIQPEMYLVLRLYWINRRNSITSNLSRSSIIEIKLKIGVHKNRKNKNKKWSKLFKAREARVILLPFYTKTDRSVCLTTSSNILDLISTLTSPTSPTSSATSNINLLLF